MGVLTSAKEMADAQKAADVAHHKRRVSWLENEGATFSDGVPLPNYFRIASLEQSKRVLNNPILGWNTCQCEPRCK